MSADRKRFESGWHRGRRLRPSRMEALSCPMDAEPMTTAVPPLAPIHSLELAADTLTPVAAALRLGPRCAFLLESVEEGARYGRYSLVGVHGRTLEVRGERAILFGGGSAEEFTATDPLEALRSILPHRSPAVGDPAFTLSSGVGYLAYETVAR